MVKSIIEIGIPKVKQYMSETNRPLKVSDVAEYLGVVDATAHGVLELMFAFGIIQKVKRGRTYYFLKDVYNEEQITAMIPSEKAPRVPRQRGRPRIPKPPPQDERDIFRKEYLAEINERTVSGGGLSALAILKMPQEWAADTVTTEPPLEVKPELPETTHTIRAYCNIKPFGTVKHLPKDVRLLSQTETRYLKNLLKGLDGCEEVERYRNVYSKFSNLKRGRYGEVFYLAIGSNPWDIVRKVTIDPTISNNMLLPKLEADVWSSWNDFVTSLKEPKRYRGQYDEMIDRFIESGHNLVEITLKNKDAGYVRQMLKGKIEERGIRDRVKTSRVDEWVYLEKVK